LNRLLYCPGDSEASSGYGRLSFTQQAMKYSLFIGRWQAPQALHDGHKKLIQKVLDEGKNVCIAIRDTEVDEKNPLTAEKRKELIQAIFPQAKVIVIPDIEEVIYGRDVGWGIRETRLDKATEAISGTELRRQNAQGSNLPNLLGNNPLPANPFGEAGNDHRAG
jgi:hypothetical protein